MEEFFENILFTIGDHEVTVEHIARLIAIWVVIFLIYRLAIRWLLPKYFAREKYVIRDSGKTVRSTRYIFILLAIIGAVWSLDLNFELFEIQNVSIYVNTILYALTIWQVADLLDWLAEKALLYNYHQSRRELDKQTTVSNFEKEKEGQGGNMVRLLVYVAAIYLVIQNFHLENYVLLSPGDYKLRLSDIFEVLLILFGARLFVWIVIQLGLYRYYKRSKVDRGSQFAINQLLKYIIYTMAALWAISSLGIQMTVLWGGAAALLVGLGLGLQQTFNDFFSGIILLFERTVELGDVLEVDGTVGTVKLIGLRTSILETRDNITVVVPNSKLVTNNVTNWSHFDKKVRFQVNVGVAYGSDTKLVKELLLKVAMENTAVLEQPSPFVRFTNFGDSSLDFELHFYSREFIDIEDVKSDLRFEIDTFFRENNVDIPFPQRTIWMGKKE